MPGFDGTGPFGQGSMSGGVRGNCPVQMSEGAGTRLSRGIRGRGLGMGRGHGNRLQADLEALKVKGQQV